MQTTQQHTHPPPPTHTHTKSQAHTVNVCEARPKCYLSLSLEYSWYASFNLLYLITLHVLKKKAVTEQEKDGGSMCDKNLFEELLHGLMHADLKQTRHKKNPALYKHRDECRRVTKDAGSQAVSI